MSGSVMMTMETRMSRLWEKAVEYYLTHDGIEMLLFACVLGFLGWMAYHAFVGVIERFG